MYLFLIIFPKKHNRLLHDLSKSPLSHSNLTVLLESLSKFPDSPTPISFPQNSASRKFFARLLREPGQSSFSLSCLKILASKGFLSRHFLRSSDIAYFIINELVANPNLIVDYSEILVHFSSKSFPVHLRSKYPSEIRAIYRNLTVLQPDLAALYLRIKQLTLSPNSTPNALALFYEILTVGDSNKHVDIYLDAFATITKFPNADFLVYPLLNNIESVTSQCQRAPSFQELTGSFLKRMKNTLYNQSFLVKAMIQDGNYIAARDYLFVEVLNRSVVDATRQRVEGFLQNLLELQSREVTMPPYRFKEATRNFELLMKGMKRHTLLEIFQSEHLDKTVLDAFPEGDWAGHVERQRDFEEFQRLFERHRGDIAAIEKEVKENKDGNKNWASIQNRLVELSKMAVEEEERLKAQRERILASLSRDIKIDDLAVGNKKKPVHIKKGDAEVDPLEESLDDPLEKPAVHSEKTTVDPSNQAVQGLNLKNKLRFDRFGHLRFDERLLDKFVSIFNQNPAMSISEKPVLEEELAFHYCKAKFEELKENEEEVRKRINRRKYDNVTVINKKSIVRVIQRNMDLYRSVKISRNYPEETMEILWSLMAWGIQKKEPFAVYLVEKACDVLGVSVPEQLARQVETFLDYSLELPGENSNHFYRFYAIFIDFLQFFRGFRVFRDFLLFFRDF